MPVPGRDHGLADARNPGEDRLDLSRLHAIAANLHLIVGPSAEHERALVRPVGEVTGPVHPLAGDEGIGDEPLGRQCRTAQVAACDTGPGDVQFPLHARRDRAQERVKDVGAPAREGTSDRQHRSGLIAGFKQPPGRAQRRLRRAVEMPHPDVRARPPGALHRRRRHLVPAGQHLAKPGDRLR